MPLSKITNPFLDPAGSVRSNVSSPAANTIAITTSGTERVRVDSSGSVGVGTTSPATKFTVNGFVLSGGQNYSARFSDAVNSTYSIAHQSGLTNLIADTAMAFYSSNTERMRIDTSGRVTMPYQPYLRATVANGTTAIDFGTTHANVTVPYNQIVENTGNHFNTSTYQFTCPVAGVYAVTATIQLGNAAGTTGVAPNFGVLRSGTAITGSYHFIQSSVGYQKMECTAFAKCAANDTLYINLYTGSSMTNGATEFNGDMRNALTIGFVG